MEAGPFFQITLPVLVGIILYISIKSQIKVVHDTFNSKMDKLLQLTETSSYAKGLLAGREGPKDGPQDIGGRVEKLVDTAEQSGYDRGHAGLEKR